MLKRAEGRQRGQDYLKCTEVLNRRGLGDELLLRGGGGTDGAVIYGN
jgi:hypothetical protein